MNKSVNEQLDDLMLRALRNGMSLEELFQLLTGKAALLSNSGPIVSAILDARTTHNGLAL